MSAKVKLISFISAFVLVLGIMIIGVLSAEQVKVNIGGSVSFNATNVYAKVSGNISGAQTGNKIFSTLTYSAEETTGDESDWTNLALEFTETPDPIEITITVENRSTQRTLTVNLENTLKGEGLDIAVTRDNGSYTSAANVELPVSTGDGSSTTTFTLTLTVANPNEDLTDVSFGYILNMYDESVAPAPPTSASSFTFSYIDANHTHTASITKFVGRETEVVIPSTVEYGGTTYTVTRIFDGSYSAAGAFYDSNITSVVIPDTVTSIGNYAFSSCYSLASVNFGNNSHLTIIGEHAFDSCISLTSITIPERVTSIGDWTFNNCRSLTSITIPSSVTSIGELAFQNCLSLTSITIPERVTSIGDQSFVNCDSLTTIEVDSANTTYSSEDGVLFNKDKTILIRYPEGNTRTSYIIPSSVTSIGDYAFWGCSSLTSITILEGVTSIGDWAFQSCRSLTSITIPEGVTSIGPHASPGCRSLTSITIPSSVKSIGYQAFDDCYALAEVYNYSNLTITAGSSSNGYLGQYAKVVYNASDLIEEKPETRITVVDNVQYYDYGDDFIALAPISGNVTEATLDNRTTEINQYAFYYCSRLATIRINATTPPRLGANAIPDNVANIYVPEGSVDAYKAASGWSSYASKISSI